MSTFLGITLSPGAHGFCQGAVLRLICSMIASANLRWYSCASSVHLLAAGAVRIVPGGEDLVLGSDLLVEEAVLLGQIGQDLERLAVVAQVVAKR